MIGAIFLALYTVGCYYIAYEVTKSLIENPIRRKP